MRGAGLAAASVILSAGPVWAQTFSLDLGEGEGLFTGRIIQLIALITVLSLAPSILVVATSFTRIAVVLSLLRSAIGIQQTPPNAVMVSLALFLTAFIMAPTLERAYEEGVVPLIDNEISEEEAFERVVTPFRGFMLANVRDKDLQLFLDIDGTEIVTRAETPLKALVPAFVISELRRAFEIAFLVFVPFIIIDMTVASVLMSMGMMMLPPVIISLPFKLIFFVLLDGWYLVAGSLIQSFNG
ncbi:MAG: flagellar type III secretion system pore protein FliP [Alphaproteobacteria bacterium]|jgi:flagellar biosynthetic protein FliP|nr:flagellar type III secretion system pore protein FliP [Alphaproteobacteria bacterium]MDP6518196.1 flagellar type III secretion system pore protein FliP [Alphaproteobacteria bacterium]|tara:strand:- start:791 stop:1516 length:726 start_codon:yes stop_codon:yes gene_type:complete